MFCNINYSEVLSTVGSSVLTIGINSLSSSSIILKWPLYSSLGEKMFCGSQSCAMPQSQSFYVWTVWIAVSLFKLSFSIPVHVYCQYHKSAVLSYHQSADIASLTSLVLSSFYQLLKHYSFWCHKVLQTTGSWLHTTQSSRLPLKVTL